jgi:hypothetical protein
VQLGSRERRAVIRSRNCGVCSCGDNRVSRDVIETGNRRGAITAERRQTACSERSTCVARAERRQTGVCGGAPAGTETPDPAGGRGRADGGRAEGEASRRPPSSTPRRVTRSDAPVGGGWESRDAIARTALLPVTSRRPSSPEGAGDGWGRRELPSEHDGGRLGGPCRQCDRQVAVGTGPRARVDCRRTGSGVGPPPRGTQLRLSAGFALKRRVVL